MRHLTRIGNGLALCALVAGCGTTVPIAAGSAAQQLASGAPGSMQSAVQQGGSSPGIGTAAAATTGSSVVTSAGAGANRLP
jgi:hypothetical protein